MTSRLRALLSYAAVLSACAVGASVQAQTITVAGCASFTTAATTAANITITCNTSAAAPPPAGTSVCSIAANPGSGAAGTYFSITGSCSNTDANTTYSLTANGTPISTAAPSGGYYFGGGVAETTTYQLTATTNAGPGTSGVTTFTVGTGGTGGTGGIDTSACTAQGYTAHVVDLAYSTTSNSRTFTSSKGSFGNSDAVVVRFTAGSAYGDTSSLQMGFVSGSPQVFRIATLSTQPCMIASSSLAGGNIVATALGKTPAFYFSIGTEGFGTLTLQPGAQYYVTYVNRNSYGGEGSCTSGSCDTYLDFNN